MQAWKILPMLAAAQAFCLAVDWSISAPPDGSGRVVKSGFEEYTPPGTNAPFIWRDSSGHHFYFASDAMVDTYYSIRLQFLNASASAVPHGLQLLPGYLNILSSADSKKWSLKKSRYAAIQFDQIYPKIDLLWEPSAGTAWFTAVVQPGGDPSLLRVQLTGAGEGTEDPTGIWYKNGPSPDPMRISFPYVYQVKGNGRVSVSAKVVLQSDGSITFPVGSYDPQLPLYIMSGFNGLSGGTGAGSTADGFQTRAFKSVPPCTSCQDVAIYSFDEKGILQWITILADNPSTSVDEVLALSSGDPIVIAHTQSDNLPVTANAPQPRRGGKEDVFLLRLNRNTGEPVASTYFGSEGPDLPLAAIAANRGLLYVGGRASSPVPVTKGAYSDPLPHGGFLLAWDSGENRIVYAAGLKAELSKMALTPGNEVYYASAGNPAVLARMRADGAALAYSTRFPAFQVDPQTNIVPLTLATDAEGNAWITARVLPAGEPAGPMLLGRFETRYQRFTFQRYTQAAKVYDSSFRIDSAGNVILVESIESENLPVSVDALLGGPCARRSTYLTKVNAKGETTFSTFLDSSLFFWNGTTLVDTNYFPVYRVLDFSKPTPVRFSCVLNSASRRGSTLVPGALMTMIGSGFGPDTIHYSWPDESGRLPTDFFGFRVLIGNLPATIVAVTRGQIVFQVPYSYVPTVDKVTLTQSGTAIDSMVQVGSPASLGFFGTVLNQDGSVNSQKNPAAAGSVVTVFGTGAGILDPPQLEGEVQKGSPSSVVNPVAFAGPGGSPSIELLYAGSAPGQNTGITQYNLRIPADTHSGRMQISNLASNYPDVYFWADPQIFVWVK